MKSGREDMNVVFDDALTLALAELAAEELGANSVPGPEV